MSPRRLAVEPLLHPCLRVDADDILFTRATAPDKNTISQRWVDANLATRWQQLLGHGYLHFISQ